jgi:hypothetical protein
MSLGGPDEDVMLSLLDFKSFLIVCVDYFSDMLLVDIFMSFCSEILHELLEWNVATGVNGESFLNCTMPEHPRHCLG